MRQMFPKYILEKTEEGSNNISVFFPLRKIKIYTKAG